jgi:hypothetical protein
MSGSARWRGRRVTPMTSRATISPRRAEEQAAARTHKLGGASRLTASAGARR